MICFHSSAGCSGSRQLAATDKGVLCSQLRTSTAAAPLHASDNIQILDPKSQIQDSRHTFSHQLLLDICSSTHLTTILKLKLNRRKVDDLSMCLHFASCYDTQSLCCKSATCNNIKFFTRPQDKSLMRLRQRCNPHQR